MSAFTTPLHDPADPTIVEQEYRQQLLHADELIDDLVEERDSLQDENRLLREMLGLSTERKHLSAPQLPGMDERQIASPGQLRLIQ